MSLEVKTGRIETFSVDKALEKTARAWQFASLKHNNQFYQVHEAGVEYPYLVHLVLVWQELVGIFSQYPSIRYNTGLAYNCAILHDTIEDTETSYEEIASLFGKSVADGVLSLTKNEQLPTKELQMKDSLSRIIQQPKEIWMVKMADRIVNLSPPPHYWKKDKIAKYRLEALLIHETLAPAHEGLANRLARKIEEYSAFL